MKLASEIRSLPEAKTNIAKQVPEQSRPFIGKIDALVTYFKAIRELPIGRERIRYLRTAYSRNLMTNLQGIGGDGSEVPDHEEFELERFTLDNVKMPLPLAEEKRLMSIYMAGREANGINYQEGQKLAKEAEEALIKAHLPLIRAMAEKYAYNEADIEDLVQEGCLTFLTSLKEHFSQKKTRTVNEMILPLFSVMTRKNRYFADTIKIPEHVGRAYLAYKRSIEQYGTTPEGALERVQESFDSSATAKHSTEEILEFFDYVAQCEMATDDSNIEEIADEDDSTDYPERLEIRRLVRTVLQTMRPLEELILLSRADEDDPEYYLVEIAEVMGFTHQHIQQIGLKGRKKFRCRMFAKHRDLVVE